MSEQFPENCERCGEPLKGTGSIMSKFNTEQICSHCKSLERQHPLYKEADQAEVEAVRRGDYNYPGVGCPNDLVAASQAARKAREESKE